MALTDFKVIKRLGKFYCNPGSKWTVNSANHLVIDLSLSTGVKVLYITFNTRQQEANLNNFKHNLNQIHNVIGEGAYSSVYHVQRILDQQVYALKKVKMVKLSEKEKENALNEVRILASI